MKASKISITASRGSLWTKSQFRSVPLLLNLLQPGAHNDSQGAGRKGPIFDLIKGLRWVETSVPA